MKSHKRNGKRLVFKGLEWQELDLNPAEEGSEIKGSSAMKNLRRRVRTANVRISRKQIHIVPCL